MTQPIRNDDEVKAFFDRWHVYSQIIRHDYMSHRGIHRALRDSLLASRQAPFCMMDLGCGDGSVMAATLRNLPVREYVGIDLSGVALDEARTSFADSAFHLSLIEGDFSDYLARKETARVDVIVAGFAVHHLLDSEKPQFFSACYEKLLEGGDLYLYDVFRQRDEDRHRYLETYGELLMSTWSELSAEEQGGVLEHIRNNDHPVSYEVLADLARQTGFDAPSSPAFADPNGYHCLCHFKRPERVRS